MRRLGRAVAAVAAYGALSALAFAPIAAERAIEDVRFQDRLGTLPVEVSLAHNGMSTLDTGILGRVYWDRTGAGGFGAFVTATGPPLAGGTLASYVSPDFVKANAQFLNDPGEIARVYGGELRSRVWTSFAWFELSAFLVGGLGLTALFRAGPPAWGLGGRRRARWVGGGIGIAVLLGSLATAGVLFYRWEGTTAVTGDYPMPGMSGLSFSSPQTLEVARQVRPFIDKFTARTRAEATAYEDAALSSFRTQLSLHAAALRPRAGERIVIAEADPQGSEVGVQVRTAIYPLLADAVGKDAFAFRTISGDLTSNGTLAEDGYVAAEARADPDLPVVAVKGDHDTAVTVEQMSEHEIANPDFEVAEVSGLRVAAGNDPAFKALFGGLVINNTGVSEQQLGRNLRAELAPSDPVIVLLHQPASVAGYLGVDSTARLVESSRHPTSPRDDGVPDLPPGIINIGHLHDPATPLVLWNTDGDLVTWTVVNQLGTSGGVEEVPTFNRFSTPFSAPLKPLTLQLQYLNDASGLETGFATISIDITGTVSITDRADLGLPGGLPVPRASLPLSD